MWLRLYVRAAIAIVLSIVVYVGIAPKLISSSDSSLVLIGILVAIIYPAVVGSYFYKKVRKFIK